MKYAIYAVCLLILLAVLSVIIFRKDSDSGDNDAIVQEETVTEGKPTAALTLDPVEKRTEVKTAEVKSAAETKSAGTKPVAAGNPVEVKPAVGTDSVEAKSLEETLAPVAVPIVKAEEAEKLNAEAIEYAIAEKEKREPFFRMYKNSELDEVCFQGTIRTVSIIPDPQENDYDNCLYTLFVEIDSLFSTRKPDSEISNEIILVAPIMKDKTIIHDNIFLPGDKIRCTCTEYDALPQDIHEIQISDGIQSFDHQQYYPLNIKKISSFQKGGIRNFAKRKITILPISSLPEDANADKARSDRIHSEITRIEKELELHGGTFAAWKEEYKPFAEKYKQLAAESYSCWINDGFFAAGGKIDGNESTYNTKAYIESILPYKNYLKKNNIDLIVIRIPTRGDFAARVLTSDTFRENPAWIEHYYECLKNDIEIVDPMPEMWKHRFDFPLFYYYMSPAEFHPYEGTYYCSSVVLGEVLERYQYKKLDRALELRRVKTKGDDIRLLYPDGNPNYSSNIEYDQVIAGEDVLSNLKTNSGSPFLFLSNSYFGKYFIKDLGLPFYCAYQLRMLPDWFYQQSLGTSMLYNLVSSPELLANRRAVIMIGCSHQDLWGRIHELPKYILDDIRSISLEKTIPLDSPDLFIVDKESLTFVPEENGGATIKASASNRFSFVLSVPNLEGKNTCMIRVNFMKSDKCSFSTYDVEEDRVIESNIKIGYGNNSHQDLFVPVSDAPKKVRIDFTSSVSQSIRNIELWYY